jgi:arabinofuranosyltransferase
MARTNVKEKPRAKDAGAARPQAAGTVANAKVSNVLFACALVLVLGRVLVWLSQPLASEDAYITFRYARMALAGHGLVYNAGERIMGFTSLPWTLWCALGMALHVDPVWWTRATSLAADLATLWLGWQLLARPGAPAAARAFAVFFAGWPMFAAASATGLETNAFLTLALLAAWLVTRGSRAAGPVLGLLAVMRPEGLAAAAVVALAAGWRSRVEALALVVACVVGLTLYYGSAVPQSVVAKALLYGTPGPWAGRHWWEWLLPFPLGRFPVASEGQHLLPLAAVFAAAVVVGARQLAREPRSGATLAAGAGLAVWLGYVTLGVAYFWWYLVLPLGAFALVAASGFAHVVRGRALPIAATLTVLGTWTVAVPLYIGRAQAEVASFGPPAELLAARGAPGESVLLEPIGWIGFRSSLRVLDESGLVSPEIARRRVQGPGWYADVVRRSHPDWLVVRAAVLESGEAFAGAGAPFRSGAERDAVLADYALEAPPSRGGTFAVYRRKAAR